jgi:neutral ceramidase
VSDPSIRPFEVSVMAQFCSRSRVNTLAFLLLLGYLAGETRARAAEERASVPVGVAQVDITPDTPIRLNGYGNRKTESEGVEQRLKAKALAIGDDTSRPVVLVTVDNCGVPGHVTDEVARRLEKAVGLARERFVVSSSHTHCAPALGGILQLIFGTPIPADQQERIDRYTRELTDKIEQVARAALDARRPGRLAWAQGEAGISVNRRPLTPEGKVVRIGVNPAGPVDRALPLLRVIGDDGQVRAVVVNYACHCTTLNGDFNKFCADWAGYACEAIEREYPSAIAMVTIGCGADANPNPRGTVGDVKRHGETIGAEARRLLKGTLIPLPGTIEARLKRIELPFGPLPTREQWQQRAGKPGAEGMHARANLARLDRGESIPTTLPYTVQTWTFGDDLAMVFLAGEVVVDYALRLKAECDGPRLWISAYCNDVPCYIASRRLIGEGGYEVDGSMIYYDRPTRLDPTAEDRIIAAVRDLLPAPFQTRRQR